MAYNPKQNFAAYQSEYADFDGKTLQQLGAGRLRSALTEMADAGLSLSRALAQAGPGARVSVPAAPVPDFDMPRANNYAEIRAILEEAATVDSMRLRPPPSLTTPVLFCKTGFSDLGSHGLRSLATALQHRLCRRLFFLDVSHNMATDMGADYSGLTALASALSMPEGGNRCTGSGSQPAGQPLHMSQLRFLSLSNNILAAPGAAALTPVLMHSRCPLEYLDLGRCSLGSAGAEALAPAFEPADEDVFTGSSAGNGGADGTGGMEDAGNRSLKWLNLSENNLCSQGLEPRPCMSLVGHLLQHPRLEYLDLSRNKLARSVLTVIINHLDTHTTLKTLLLDDNGIDAVPAAAIAEALTKNTTLTHLSLRHNRVRSDGASAFAALLRVNLTLKHLDLRGNYVGELGQADLKAALLGQPTPSTVLDPPPLQPPTELVQQAQQGAARAAGGAGTGSAAGVSAAGGAGTTSAAASNDDHEDEEEEDEEAAAERRRQRWAAINAALEAEERAAEEAEGAAAEAAAAAERGEAEQGAGDDITPTAGEDAGTTASDATAGAPPRPALSLNMAEEDAAVLSPATPSRVAGSGVRAALALRKLASPIAGGSSASDRQGFGLASPSSPVPTPTASSASSVPLPAVRIDVRPSDSAWVEASSGRVLLLEEPQGVYTAAFSAL